MAKKAYYEYGTETEFFCEALHSDWVPMPSIGLQSIAVALKVTLLIHFELSDKGPIEPPGRQAALYFLFDRNLKHVDAIQARFLHDVGVELVGPQRPIISQHRYIMCKFGEPDPVFAFQPVIKWWQSSEQQFREYRDALEAVRKPVSLPWDLQAFGTGQYARGKKRKLDLSARPKLSALFEALLSRFPNAYSAADLARDIWDNPALLQSVYQAIPTLKAELKVLGLTITTKKRVGYTLCSR